MSRRQMKADLHLHHHLKKRLFYCPLLYDSVQTTAEIINRAVQLNIKIIAITDHDSLAGSDAHLVEEVGRSLTIFPEKTQTAADILNYIKTGNFQVRFSPSPKITVACRHVYRNLKLQLKPALDKRK